MNKEDLYDKLVTKKAEMLGEEITKKILMGENVPSELSQALMMEICEKYKEIVEGSKSTDSPPSISGS